MTGIKHMTLRVTQDPMNFAAAMAAGAFGPTFVAKLLPQGMRVTDQILQLGCGAVTFYVLDPAQDGTSMIIGAGAGFAGPIVKKQLKL